MSYSRIKRLAGDSIEGEQAPYTAGLVEELLRTKRYKETADIIPLAENGGFRGCTGFKPDSNGGAILYFVDGPVATITVGKTKPDFYPDSLYMKRYVEAMLREVQEDMERREKVKADMAVE